MPEHAVQQPTETTDYIEDAVGADIPEDVVKVALEINRLTSGIPLEGPLEVDDSDLQAALASTADADEDPLLSMLVGADGDHVADAQLGDDVPVTTVAIVTYMARALDTIGEARLQIATPNAIDASAEPLGLENTDDSQIDPDVAPEYPASVTGSHDLDPTNGDGDLVAGPVGVRRSASILIAANSTDDNNWSASVRWLDATGGVIQTESATDISLSGVDNANAQLERKGPRVEVTFTSEVADGTANTINAYVDAHR